MRGDDAMSAADRATEKKKRHNAKARKVEIVPFRELLTPDLQDRSLIKDVLAKGAVALMLGPAGCGKTFLALDIALHVAAGIAWQGRRTQPGCVVYVAAEAGRGIRNRIAAWAKERLETGDLLNLIEIDLPFRAVVSPVDLCHLDAGDVEKLIEAIGSADLVIIDTVSRALAGGNENGPEDMGAFVTALDRLRDKLGAAMLAVHHVGKDASRGGRGHSLLHCAVDTEIEVERRDDISVAMLSKQRDGPTGLEIAFKLQSVELGRDEHGDAVTSCVVEPSEYVPEAKSIGPVGQARDALLQLNYVYAERAELRVSGDVEHRAVKIEAWHEAMAKSKLFGEERSNRFRAACTRVRQRLEQDGHIGVADGYVWPTRPTAAGGPF